MHLMRTANGKTWTNEFVTVPTQWKEHTDTPLNGMALIAAVE